jgi:hypothetical protein
MSQIEYVPGVCNIGPREISRRRMFGWVSLTIAVVLLAALISVGVNPWWRLFVFFPTTMSASGFLQSYFHFCSGFARKGIFNFGSPGTTNPVADETSKIKDKKRGNQIMLYAVLIGIVISILSILV